MVNFFLPFLYTLSQCWGSCVDETVIGATSSLQTKDKGHSRACHQYTVKSWFPWVHPWLEPNTRGPLLHLPGVYSTDIEEQKVLAPPPAPSMRDPWLDGTACVNSDCFTYITLQVYFGISCTIFCFCFLAFFAISYTSQRGEQPDAGTSLPWFPLQDLCPGGLPLL